MNFAILAAGEGSRLRNEGLNMPKGLVRLGGIPLVERIIRIADKYSPSSINCIVNEKSVDLSEFISELEIGTPLNQVIKSTPSSMHSLYELSHLLRDENFCLFTVDTIFKEEELSTFLEYAQKQSDCDAVFAVTDYIDDEKPLYIETNEDDQITAFLDTNDNPKYVSGGIYYLPPKALDVLQECIDAGQQRLRNFQRMLLERNMKIKAFRFSKIIDVDHISDLEKAEKFLGE
jgi:NDP-sugar pyrophosphorylase family protein